MKNKTLVALLFASAIGMQACNSSKNDSNATDSSITDSGSVISATDTLPVADSLAVTDSLTRDPGKYPTEFMTQAAIGGMMEIAAAKVAQKNAADPKVKEFAALMIKDHTAASNELSGIARSKEFSLPSTLPAKEQMHLDEMKKLSGADFDKHYMDMMVNDHKKTVDLFKSAKSLSDADLMLFATKTLKTIELHNRMAEDLNGLIKAK
ncbi:DUF4142 domain-containing protein [Pedobacter metabolipauper]|uniref:Putative membrane protein n=1 Tax=Pedobacter metabolipauper TaxID=425513 RepID=A0A4V3D1N9_9SPHI|nr:DUF4142 domain-containing protein [Pedobacter metabolipauper]TDQ11883.1 putative membrane protein [Pedobacter metabolipauper]